MARICLVAPSGPRTVIWAPDGGLNPVTDGVVSPVTETATMAPASAAATTQPATRLVSALPSLRAPPDRDRGAPAAGAALAVTGSAGPSRSSGATAPESAGCSFSLTKTAFLAALSCAVRPVHAVCPA